MKYLLVLAVVAIAFWLWRKARRPGVGAKAAPAAPPPDMPLAMARCAHCGLHLPAAEAIAGERGRYCCAAHRQLAEPADRV